MINKGSLNWKPTTSTTYTVPAGYYSGGTLDSSDAYNAGYNEGLSVIPTGSRYGVATINGSGPGKSFTATVPAGSTVVARGVSSSSSGFGCSSLSTYASISGTTLTVSVGGANITGGFGSWTMVVVYKY